MEERNKSGKFFKTKLCPWHASGACRLGNKCNWAHGKAEVRQSVDLTKTKLCPDLFRHGKCDKTTCRFAHNRNEIRATSDVFKTSLCMFWMKGGCFVGSRCRYAHGLEDLRRPSPANSSCTNVPIVLHAEQRNNPSPNRKKTANNLPENSMCLSWTNANEAAIASALTKRRERIAAGPQSVSESDPTLSKSQTRAGRNRQQMWKSPSLTRPTSSDRLHVSPSSESLVSSPPRIPPVPLVPFTITCSLPLPSLVKSRKDEESNLDLLSQILREYCGETELVEEMRACSLVLDKKCIEEKSEDSSFTPSEVCSAELTLQSIEKAFEEKDACSTCSIEAVKSAVSRVDTRQTQAECAASDSFAADLAAAASFTACLLLYGDEGFPFEKTGDEQFCCRDFSSIPWIGLKEVARASAALKSLDETFDGGKENASEGTSLEMARSKLTCAWKDNGGRGSAERAKASLDASFALSDSIREAIADFERYIVEERRVKKEGEEVAAAQTPSLLLSGSEAANRLSRNHVEGPYEAFECDLSLLEQMVQKSSSMASSKLAKSQALQHESSAVACAKKKVVPDDNNSGSSALNTTADDGESEGVISGSEAST